MIHQRMTPRRARLVSDASACGILLVSSVGTALAGPVIVPPNATPNTKAISTALQQLCAVLQTPASGNTFSSAQRDLAQRCAFFQDPAEPAAALTSAYAAIGGQQVNALGPQSKKFASLQQDNLTSRVSELRHGAEGLSLTRLELRGDDNRLLAANNVSDFLPFEESGASGGGGENPVSTMFDGRLGMFVNGTVHIGSKAESTNSFAFDIKDTSVTAGLDYRVTPWFVVGASYGSGKTQTLFANQLGRLDLNAGGGSIFASVYGPSVYFNVLAGYGGTRLNTERDLDYTDTTSGVLINQQALGKSHLHDLWAGFAVGDDVSWERLTITPEASLNYHEVRLDGFTESMSEPGAPGAGLALAFGDGVVPSVQGKLNLRVAYSLSTPIGVFVPEVHGTFIREFRARSDAFSAQFAVALATPGASDMPAYIHTDAPEGHYFANGAGVTAQFAHGFAAFFDYDQLRTLKTIKSHQLDLGVRYNVQ